MAKKIVLLVLILGLFGGGFFYWWNSQTDVRELNKTLPEGIKIVKSLWGDEYSVVNKTDGYSFKVPKEWGGVNEIAYIPEREEMGYGGTSLNLRGREKEVIGIDQFTSGENMDSDLKLWAQTQSDTFGLAGDLMEETIEEISVVKTQESIHFGGEYTYFLKKAPIIYSFTSPSENSIKYIIINGKW